MWKKSLNLINFPHQLSDRVCGAQLFLPQSGILTILGVYMPSSESPEDVYSFQLEVVDESLSKIHPSSPVLLVGDLNCHLGHLGGPRSSDTPNSRGWKWKELIDHHSLYVPSLSSLSQGPVHTYHSGSVSSTVDYVVGNHAISQLLTSCCSMDDHPLNTSDHLPLSLNLRLRIPSSTLASNSSSPLNWRAATTDGSSATYAKCSDDLVRHLIEKDYSSVDELDSDLSSVAESLLSLSKSTIPHHKHSRHSNH